MRLQLCEVLKGSGRDGFISCIQVGGWFKAAFRTADYRLTHQDLMNRVNMHNTKSGRFNFLILKSPVVSEYRQANGPQCVVTGLRPSSTCLRFALNNFLLKYEVWNAGLCETSNCLNS
jgi:hypothetical protein